MSSAVATASGQPSILVVDDSPDNLRVMVTLLEQGGYVARPVTSGRRAIEAAVRDPPDLVLLDVRMPEMSGLEVCKWLKDDERLRSTPVIFISALASSQDKTEAFRAGALDYITRPFDALEVLARVRIHLRLRQLETDLALRSTQLENRIAEQVAVVTSSQSATIFALAKLAEAREQNLGRHLERVQLTSKLLAKQMRQMGFEATGLTEAFVSTLFETAALHDIGKVGLPDAVLLNTGELTEDQRQAMRQHCLLGAQTLEAVLARFPDNPFLRIGVEVTRSHHERWDGSGYPDRLCGEKIPLSARIVAVADVFDALTSKRSFRPAFPPDRAREMVEAGGGVGFDPNVVAAFRAIAAKLVSLRLASPDT
jgi:putative two-component system response regulator